MATKTLTIMEDAYHLLVCHKHEDESFSDVIRRVLSRKPKKTLADFAGILTKEEGELLLNDLEQHKEREIELVKRRINEASR